MSLPAENINNFSPHWPLCLMALSLTLFLGWQMTIAAQQYFALLRLADQQNVLAGQAAQAESQLKSLMMDLLTLAKTDADAKAIVGKYGIKFNPTPASSPDSELEPPDSKPARAQNNNASGSGTWTDDNTHQRHQK